MGIWKRLWVIDREMLKVCDMQFLFHSRYIKLIIILIVHRWASGSPCLMQGGR